ncbi:MAG: hypothetical protein RRB13_15220 [bacterium]|nr:hypothetical protein [bacterium]
MSPIQIQLMALAQQLAKLLKVIQHSDPSAAAMKKPLYEKYKAALEELHDEWEGQLYWPELKRRLDELPQLPGWNLEEQTGGVVLDKLRRDLEDRMVPKQQLSELEPGPKPVGPPRRRPPKKRPAPAADPEFLLKLAQMDSRQAEASRSLQGLIDVINRLDPEFLEKKILSSVPKDLDPKEP